MHEVEAKNRRCKLKAVTDVCTEIFVHKGKIMVTFSSACFKSDTEITGQTVSESRIRIFLTALFVFFAA